VANFLMRLQAGQLLNSSNTNVMLSDMGRQKYRSAIPAGAAGSTVLDKVGFIDNVWNDAAIVHGPKASYVLVVMTQNGGPDVIKDLTQRIQTLIN
ncbi:MAG: serine hydrolase, partial [Candidatus Saccharimonadales bacterium]